METVYYNCFDSPLGIIGMAFTRRGLYAIALAQGQEEEFCHQLRRRKVSLVKDGSVGKELEVDILSYLAGERINFSGYELDLTQATRFQRTVWQEVRKIPYGQTRSYRWIAEQIGQPQAQRAVGMANRLNPLPLVIPCHRVIRSDGHPGGYSAGIGLKRMLLSLEGAREVKV